ncbi:MAG: zinc-ribbon domain containing protein [Bacteroidales bacterium]|nr:zinc-ribbon domain containing protein [Bacteroidales bacterium]MCM1415011.1 zinc-ribbon domain containing protein [bacterium]MCM1422865.1 zinc-ribbon domain containing protein [bacterium]
MKRICKQCGAEFTLTEQEIAFYQSKNLHLPKRCEACRRENKESANKAQQVVRPYQSSRNAGSRGKIGAAAAAVVVLAACIGVFWYGRSFEQEQSGIVNEVIAESAADFSQTAETQEAANAPADVPAEEEAAKASADVPIEEEAEAEPPEEIQPAETPAPASTSLYFFRKEQYLQEHFEKHGAEFGYASADEYLAGANRVIASPEALHKLEAEDGDDVYYLEASNEFVIVSTDGYIRTYLKPDDGKAYFDRQ